MVRMLFLEQCSEFVEDWCACILVFCFPVIVVFTVGRETSPPVGDFGGR